MGQRKFKEKKKPLLTFDKKKKISTAVPRRV